MIAHIERNNQRLPGPFETVEQAIQAWINKYSPDSLVNVAVASFTIYYDFGNRFQLRTSQLVSQLLTFFRFRTNKHVDFNILLPQQSTFKNQFVTNI